MRWRRRTSISRTLRTGERIGSSGRRVSFPSDVASPTRRLPVVGAVNRSRRWPGDGFAGRRETNRVVVQRLPGAHGTLQSGAGHSALQPLARLQDRLRRGSRRENLGAAAREARRELLRRLHRPDQGERSTDRRRGAGQHGRARQRGRTVLQPGPRNRRARTNGQSEARQRGDDDGERRPRTGTARRADRHAGVRTRTINPIRRPALPRSRRFASASPSSPRSSSTTPSSKTTSTPTARPPSSSRPRSRTGW